MDAPQFNKISQLSWDYICLYIHARFLKWLWQDSVERKAWDHAGASIAQLEKNWIRVISIRLRSMTLVLKTFFIFLYQIFCHLSLDYLSPFLFIYSFIPLLLPSASMSICYESTLFQVQRITREPEGMVSAITWAFPYGNDYNLVIWAYLILL